MLLVISSTSRGPLRKLRRRSEGRWAYLGRDHLKLLEWEKKLGSQWKHTDYTKEFQELARQWRDDYVRWVSQKGKTYPKLLWWTSRFAERNTLIDSVYHGICYLEIARRLIERKQIDLFVVERQGTLEVLCQYLNGAAIAHLKFGGSWFKSRLNWVGRFFLGWIYYLARAAYSSLLAIVSRHGKRRLPNSNGKPIVFVRATIDDTYFKKNRDCVLTILPDEIEKRGYHIVVLPWILNVSLPLTQVFRWFRKDPDRYLIPEDWYNLEDWLWAMIQVIKQIRIPRGISRFRDFDISPLIQEEQRRQSATFRHAEFMLYYRLIEHLSQHHFKVDYFLDTFENMLFEKPCTLGFREFMPETVTVGYSHLSSLPTMMLCYFTNPDEISYSIHPDVIVCNSSFLAGFFRQQGFPQNQLKIGPSVRYLHLLNSPARVTRNTRKILVAFSLESHAVAYLLDTLLKAFENSNGALEFLLKPHPLFPSKEWNSLFGNRLPPHMKVVEGTIGDCLSEACCAIISSSTVSIEIALTGVPIVQLGRQTDFDMNVMEWFHEFAGPVYSAQDLKTEVLRLVNLSAEERTEAKERALRLAKECLTPLSEETLSVFLPDRREVFLHRSQTARIET